MRKETAIPSQKSQGIIVGNNVKGTSIHYGTNSKRLSDTAMIKMRKTSPDSTLKLCHSNSRPKHLNKSSNKGKSNTKSKRLTMDGLINHFDDKENSKSKTIVTTRNNLWGDYKSSANNRHKNDSSHISYTKSKTNHNYLSNPHDDIKCTKPRTLSHYLSPKKKKENMTK